MSAPTDESASTDMRELFHVALDMAQAAKTGNVSGWLAARSACRRTEDMTFLLSQMLGTLVENGAIREGVHPADVWGELRERGIDEFG